MPIRPKHIWEKVTDPKTFPGRIGTGPYKLVDYKADQYYKFEANKDYFLGKPSVDQLVMPIIKDSTAIFAALKAGEIDAVSRPLSPELVRDFQGIAQMKVVAGPVTLSQMLLMNNRIEPFNNKDFRKAVALAINHSYGALLFWGFCFFLLSYIIFIGLAEGFGFSSFISGGAFERAYFYILDFAGVVVLLAVVWAAVRRYILRPQRLVASMEAGLILIFVSTLMALHLVTQGLAYASAQASGSLPPVSAALAGLFTRSGMSGGTLAAFHNIAWWLHYGLILGFLVYIPRSKHFQDRKSVV